MEHAPLARANIIGRYRLLAELGRGGMAKVYLAIADVAPAIRGFHKLCVVKVLKPDLANEPEFVEVFLEEARVAARLNHSNIVHAYEVGEANDAYFLVMEYLEGQPYSRLWNGPRRSGVSEPPKSTLPLAHRIYVLCQTLAGLEYVHDLKDYDGTPLGLVHRDVTPHNVLVTYDGQVKLLDFGIAKATSSSSATLPGIVKGKTAYMAPEQARGEAVDHRADLYSVGVMLWEAAAGKRMWEGVTSDSMMHRLLVGDLPDLRGANPLVTVELERVCRKALALDPAGRYASASAFRSDLLRALENAKSVAASDLGRVVARAFDDERVQIRALVEAQIKKADTRGIDDLVRLVTPHSETSLSSNPPPAQDPQRRDSSLRPLAAPLDPSPKSSRRGGVLAAVGVAATIALGGFFGVTRWNRIEPAASSARAGSLTNTAITTTAKEYPRGVTRDAIRLGMSAAFSGSARELGAGMKVGLQTAFSAINDLGGVHGRKLSLVALDDGYEGPRALDNVKELIDTREVFALIGNVGTPTAEQAMPFARERKTIFFGAFTGAGLLRQDPPDRYVINYRASYAEETSRIVSYLVERKKLKPEEIVVFAQQDGYGNAGFAGVAKAIRKFGRDDSQILRVGYKRNTADVDAAVDEVVRYAAQTETIRSGGQDFARYKHPVRAVVMVATYKAAARFIQKLKDKKLDPIFTNVSFVGSDALAEELRELGPRYGTGVIVTQVVPHFSSGATGVIRYREELKKYFSDQQPGFVSLEGYVVGRIFVEALKLAGPSPDTEAVVNAFESVRDLDLGLGTKVTYGLSEHQGSHKVWGTVLSENGRYDVLDLD